jgi:hypothetical protein
MVAGRGQGRVHCACGGGERRVAGRVRGCSPTRRAVARSDAVDQCCSPACTPGRVCAHPGCRSAPQSELLRRTHCASPCAARGHHHRCDVQSHNGTLGHHHTATHARPPTLNSCLSRAFDRPLTPLSPLLGQFRRVSSSDRAAARPTCDSRLLQPLTPSPTTGGAGGGTFERCIDFAETDARGCVLGAGKRWNKRPRLMPAHPCTPATRAWREARRKGPHTHHHLRVRCTCAAVLYLPHVRRPPLQSACPQHHSRQDADPQGQQQRARAAQPGARHPPRADAEARSPRHPRSR